ncbi:hypothetical protein GCM10028806_34150 [Spirosoma terrae]|uniref:CHAP domain-containing protein n=1 Tax=Spirosoma terrae TaxID=1968276 RepID=A0A6L9LB96_9BACT|nr:CHAP domain-containing protein [Spirosoma terrae]NDU95728.1 CHAP domain-containing protein [Spirosoma terrae]
MTLLQAAQSQVGVEESPRGSNWGYSVEQYLKSVGIYFPAAWCMAFCYWCAEKAARAQNDINPLFKTGGVLKQWNSSTSLRVKADDVRPGDIFIMDYGKGQGHAGIVEQVIATREGTRFHTIEGNTNDEGSREGFVVCRRSRKAASIKGFLRTNL